MKKKKDSKVNEPAINSTELIEAMNALEKESGIQKEYLLESIETALVTAYKRNFDCEEENVKVTMDKETGEIHIYAQKEVVKKVENDKLQIKLDEAKKINKNLEIGDTAEIELIPRNFGRIAAGTAKQVIIQKIREASREFLYNEFNERKGEIVSGIVQKADGGVVIVDLGRLEGVMTVKEQIPTEHYHVNDKIRACIIDVEKGLKGSTQVMISRAHNDFVRKLFELEIPEIYEGLIEIKSVSRDPGNRCKVAVYSQNPNIDPVGSCVGQKGIRIQNIINELNGEKIDVIEWNENPATFISSALLPAQVMAVDVKEDEHFAQVIVPDNQLSLAIGKAGQNARLAAKLTNWKIDIKSESQIRQVIAEMQNAEATNHEEESNTEVNEAQAIEEAEKLVQEVDIEEKTSKKSTKKAKEETEEKPKKGAKKAAKKDEEVEEKPKKATKKVAKKDEKAEEKTKKGAKKAAKKDEEVEEKPKKATKKVSKKDEEVEEKPKKATKKVAKKDEEAEEKPKKATKKSSKKDEEVEEKPKKVAKKTTKK